jgi:alkylation response protein AidB-like acyl-CoA dehydrogenase
LDLKLTAEQEQLERDARYYLENKVPAGLEEELETEFEGGGPIYGQFMRQLGSDGWLGIGWPKEFGGQGRSPIEQYIFFGLTLGYYRIPLPMLTINAIGPVIMRHGTQEQRKYFLPKILNGELTIAIGYTEPEAGTDLASLRTTAVKDGDYYIINGQKSFTTFAQFCDYIWLATRTDPQAPKHKGISMFLVDAKIPGISVQPLTTMSGLRSTYTFYENVRVPKEYLIGEENKGWLYINHQLAGERIGLVPHFAPLRYLEDITKWVKEHRLGSNAVIRHKLAETAIETEVLRLLNYRVAWMLTQGRAPHAESAMIKVFGSEQALRVLNDCLDIMGLFGQLQTGSKWVPFRGRLETMLRVSVVNLFGGGANDVLRDIVAADQGLPVSR